jgi:hypothetical protein
MAKSDDLFGVGGRLRQKLLQHTFNPDIDVIVNKVCDNVGLAFKLWDDAFSAIHLPNPTVENIAQKLKNELTTQWHTSDQWDLA